jgi:riboflavin-specific deaminase-like protein
VRFRRLLPDQAEVDEGSLLEALHRDIKARDDRPYTIVNFISSADGRATVHGRSGGLGDEGDRAMFHGLREQADAVLVGTGTLRTENYGRILGKAERRQRRVAAGREAEPLACIVTRSGDIPERAPLFAEPEARVVVFTGAELDLSQAAAQVEVIRRGQDELSLTDVFRHMRADHSVELLLCEGGPILFGGLLSEGLVDELFLSLAPKLVGGGLEPTITAGPELPEPVPLGITWLLERAGTLYVRYSAACR